MCVNISMIAYDHDFSPPVKSGAMKIIDSNYFLKMFLSNKSTKIQVLSFDTGIFVEFRHSDQIRTLARFSLDEFPNCPAICISSGAYVEEAWRGRGIGQTLTELREYLCTVADYSMIMATVEAGNVPEIHILTKRKWKHIDTLYNKLTGHELLLFRKMLKVGE